MIGDAQHKFIEYENTVDQLYTKYIVGDVQHIFIQ